MIRRRSAPVTMPLLVIVVTLTPPRVAKKNSTSCSRHGINVDDSKPAARDTSIKVLVARSACSSGGSASGKFHIPPDTSVTGSPAAV